MKKINLKVVAMILGVAILLAIAFGVGNKFSEIKSMVTTEPTETSTQPTETSTQPTTQPTETTTLPTTTEAPVEESSLSGIKLCLYYKVNGEFKSQDITKYLVESIDTAEIVSPTEVEIIMDGERQYIEPEVRLYGVPLGQFVSVSCESMLTKAYYVTIGQNDGAYQYYYWQPRMYSASEQGEYSFKLTIKEGETEKTMYYKIAV